MKSSVRMSKSSVAGSGSGSTKISIAEEEVPFEDNDTAELTDSNRSDNLDLNDSLFNSNASTKSRFGSSFSTQSRGGSTSTVSSSLRSNTSSSITDRIKLSQTEHVQSVNVEKMTMNKLRFASLKLHGRKKEMKLLRSCFSRFVNNVANMQSASNNEGGDTLDNVSKQQSLAQGGSKKIISELLPDFSRSNSSEVVFISGESGTGKSALAQSIKGAVQRGEGIYISGKFDLQNLREPFSGIISLFRELCGCQHASFRCLPLL